MRVLWCAALLIAGCRIELSHRESADANTSGRACRESAVTVCKVDAPMHSDHAWIEQRIFVQNCTVTGGQGCHESATASGKVDLSAGHSYAALLGDGGTGGVKSNIVTSRDLVVPNNAKASYLFLMIRGVAPEDAEPPGSPPPEKVGYMPQNNPALCCEKVDAIERWIMNGAPPN